MTDPTPFDRLDQYIEQGRLIRKAWRGGQRTADGYKRACLLVALSPEVGETREESDCPASTMWPWLAQLTPWIDDVGSEEKWPEVVRRYASAVRRLDPSDDAASRRALLASLHAIVTEARSHAASGRYAAACDRVLALLREAPPADDPRWATAAMEAWAAWAAWEMAVTRAAMEAATAAMEARVAARMAARAAMAAAGAVNGEAAADRIIDGILTALESEAMR